MSSRTVQRRDRALGTVASIALLALLGCWLALRGSSPDPAAALPSEQDRDARVEAARSGPARATSPDPPLELDSGARRTAEAARAPDPVGTVIFGAVLDPSGQPLGGGTVVCERAGGGAIGSDIHGSYSVSGLGTGRWRVTWTVPQFFAETRELVLEAEPKLLRIDVELDVEPRPRIRALTPQGEPLSKALLRANLAPTLLSAAATERRPQPLVRQAGSIAGTFQPSRPAHSDDDGSIGWLRVQRRPPVHVSLTYAGSALASRELAQPAEEIEFVCSLEDVLRSLGSLRLRAVDAAGLELVNDLKVEILDCTIARMAPPLRPWPGQIDAIVPGRIQVLLSAPGLLSEFVPAVIEPGRVCDLGTIELQRVVAIRGRALDPGGQARPVPVACLRADPENGGWAAIAKAGAPFEFASLPQALYALRVEGDGPYAAWGADCALVDTREGPVPEVILQLRPTRAVMIRCQAGEAKAFEVRDERGVPLRAGSLPPGGLAKLKIPTGRYSLAWSDAFGERAPKEILVGDAPLEVELGP